MSRFGFPGMLAVGRYSGKMSPGVGGPGKSPGEMSTSALRMVLDDLKEMLRAKAISPADFLVGVAAAHTRASSLEKEVPVKMQEVVKEELSEASPSSPVKMETPVKMKVKMKSVMKAPVMKEFVPPLSSPRQVGEKAPSDNNNNNKVVVVSVVGDRGMIEVGDSVEESCGRDHVNVVAEEFDGAVFGVGAAVDHPWSAVDDSTDKRCDEEEIGVLGDPLSDHEVAALGGGVVASLTRSVIDDSAVEEFGGAVFGFEAAVDHPWSAVDDSTDKRCDEEEMGVLGYLASDLVATGGVAGGLTRKGDDAEESGGAEGHSCSCDAEALLPGVDVSVTKGMVWGDELCDVSGNAWVTWNWVRKLIMCDSLPEGGSQFRDAIIQQITTAGDDARSYVVRRHVDPGVGISATKGLSECRWKVQVVWMVEEKLAKMQIDAVITDVTSEESANPGCEEESVRVESHLVVGIYFGRR